ncbi:3'-5' exonuclease [Geobacillus subterraneus]|uniref:3'-5' exonuclease n=1 Tax=Geobacillus subterraneus TaxID=129338 RepID=UPI00160E32AE
MNERHRFWQRALRLLSLGVPREASSALLGNDHSLQQERWLRSLQKENGRSVDWHGRLPDIPFVIMDMETTGFSPQQGDEILAMAAAKTVNGLVTGTYMTLVKPEKPIPEHISDLTGITAKDVMFAPPLAEALRTFVPFIATGVLVGYHIGHDVSFLRHALWHHYRQRWSGRFIDMQPMVGLVRHPCPTLDDALACYGIDCPRRHTADGDVEAMVKLWAILLGELHELGIETLHDLYAALSRH